MAVSVGLQRVLVPLAISARVVEELQSVRVPSVNVRSVTIAPFAAEMIPVVLTCSLDVRKALVVLATLLCLTPVEEDNVFVSEL